MITYQYEDRLLSFSEFRDLLRKYRVTVKPLKIGPDSELEFVWWIAAGAELKYEGSRPYFEWNGLKRYFANYIPSKLRKKGWIKGDRGETKTVSPEIWAKFKLVLDYWRGKDPNSVVLPETTRSIKLIHLPSRLQERLVDVIGRAGSGHVAVNDPKRKDFKQIKGRRNIEPQYNAGGKLVFRSNLEWDECWRYEYWMNFRMKQFLFCKVDEDFQTVALVSDVMRVAFWPMRRDVSRQPIKPEPENVNYEAHVIQKVLKNPDVQALCRDVLAFVYPDGNPDTCLQFNFPILDENTEREAAAVAARAKWDELAQAKKRIAELEEKIESLEATLGSNGVPEPWT